MIKRTLIYFTLFALALGACSKQPTIDEAVQTGVEHAGKQLLYQTSVYDTLDVTGRSWEDGKYRFIKPRDWTSGFFPGSLWLYYDITGDKEIEQKAYAYTARQKEVPFMTHTHDLGFMVFCSYGWQQRIEKDSVSEAAIIQASESLISRYNQEIGLIRSWDFGKWNYPVIIDNMMNLEMLFWASERTGDSKYRDIAIQHADNTMKNHFRDDYSAYHVVSYNDDGSVESKGTWQGYSDESAWSRGEAWALYGYTVCYRYTGYKRYLEMANHVADFIINHKNTPEDLVPYWDYDAPGIPNEPRDASAAALYASAFLELSTMLEGDLAQKYRDYAEKLIISLSSPAYLAEPGTNGGFILMHSTGAASKNSEIDVPINYADYYYMEALQRYLNMQK